MHKFPIVSSHVGVGATFPTQERYQATTPNLLPLEGGKVYLLKYAGQCAVERGGEAEVMLL